MNKHDGWLKAAGDACSFMRMYALALEISTEAKEQHVRRASTDVVSVLEGVIDRPIADARKLKEARRLFTVMIAHLCDQNEWTKPPTRTSFTLKMSMRSR
ncbi:hypothetical protein [Neorhizobium sp. JUb45]|uniref:hypothetical protein n=1 Tax=Neorhizobium sp. JUb45 TaxID=2485113 RepID=UPI00104CD9F2|nr:hypothetical protein [Neorhizobium sp. JUb45]